MIQNDPKWLLVIIIVPKRPKNDHKWHKIISYTLSCAPDWSERGSCALSCHPKWPKMTWNDSKCPYDDHKWPVKWPSMTLNDHNDPKCTKMTQNDPTLFHTHYRVPRIDPKGDHAHYRVTRNELEITRNDTKWAKNDSKWPKMGWKWL